MLSFPDASGSTPVKSARGEFSSPLDSGFHPDTPSVHDGRKRLHSPALNPAWSCCCWAVNKMWLSHSWHNEVSASDKELCNDESDKYPEEGAAGRPAAGRRRRRDARLGERPRRQPCALPSAGAFCSPLNHCCSSPDTGRQDALPDAVTRFGELRRAGLRR